MKRASDVFHLATLTITPPSAHFARGDRTLVRPHSDCCSARRGFLFQDWYLILPHTRLSPGGADFSRPARGVRTPHEGCPGGCITLSSPNGDFLVRSWHFC